MNIDINLDRYTCDESFWMPNYQCLMDCEDGWRKWKDLKSPYDFDSIMHYYGGTCSDGQGPLMVYKGTTSVVNPSPPGQRMTTQDALQVNMLYECPLQKTLPCNSWNYPSQSVYLESRKCDGIADCIDGSDELAEICNVQTNCAEVVVLAGVQYIETQEVNAHSYYESFDSSRKLCFYLGSLIGHGYWIVMENLEEQIGMCDLTCGAIIYADHTYTERCVVGTIFNRWNEDKWITPKSEEIVFYTAEEDEGTFESTTTMGTTKTTPALNDMVEIRGAVTHIRYNGIYEEIGILNSQKYYQKENGAAIGRNVEYSFIFASESGLWKISNELNSVWADYYTSTSEDGLAAGTSWFVNKNDTWVIEQGLQAEVQTDYVATNECLETPTICNDDLRYCTDRLVGYECLCIIGYTEKDSVCEDIDECNQDVCGTSYDCMNTIGSYQCNCIVGTYQHYPLEEVDLSSLFDISDATQTSNIVSDTEVSSDSVNDIRFTLNQFHEYKNQGIHIPLTLVDRPAMSREYQDMGYSHKFRGADATASKWKSNWNDDSNKYDVPWLFHIDYPEELKELVRNAILHFKNSTCIHFVEISVDDITHWSGSIMVHKGEDGPNQSEGCWSYVGRISTSVTQYLSLSEGCHSPETIQHEFYHALGFWHEQQRADVLDYIDLHDDQYSCDQSSWTSNYQCLNGCDSGFRQWYDLKSPYDYDSIMHYDGNQCGPAQC